MKMKFALLYMIALEMTQFPLQYRSIKQANDINTGFLQKVPI